MLSAKQVELYFQYSKKGLLVACVIVAIIGIALLIFVNWIAGIVGILIAVGIGYFRTMIPDDAEIDEFFARLATFWTQNR